MVKKKHYGLPKLICDFYLPFSRLVTKPLVRTRVTPNQITILGLFVVVLSGYFFSRGDYHSLIIAVVLLQICFVLDQVDGELARLTGRSSVWGAFLDSFSDRISTAVILFGISWGVVQVTQNSIFWMIGFIAVSSILLGEFLGLQVTLYFNRGGAEQGVSVKNHIISSFRFRKLGGLLVNTASVVFMGYLGWTLNIALITIFGLANELDIYLIFASIYGTLHLIYSLFAIWLRQKWMAS